MTLGKVTSMQNGAWHVFRSWYSKTVPGTFFRVTPTLVVSGVALAIAMIFLMWILD